jgi:hypothetical protein
MASRHAPIRWRKCPVHALREGRPVTSVPNLICHPGSRSFTPQSHARGHMECLRRSSCGDRKEQLTCSDRLLGNLGGQVTCPDRLLGNLGGQVTCPDRLLGNLGGQVTCQMTIRDLVERL